MTTNERSERAKAHEHYVSKINNLVAQGRDSLIANLVADYEAVRHETVKPIDKAA
jgi:hypothetical protein